VHFLVGQRRPCKCPGTRNDTPDRIPTSTSRDYSTLANLLGKLHGGPNSFFEQSRSAPQMRERVEHVGITPALQDDDIGAERFGDLGEEIAVDVEPRIVLCMWLEREVHRISIPLFFTQFISKPCSGKEVSS